jgi:hypothetical protein
MTLKESQLYWLLANWDPSLTYREATNGIDTNHVEIYSPSQIVA